MHNNNQDRATSSNYLLLRGALSMMSCLLCMSYVYKQHTANYVENFINDVACLLVSFSAFVLVSETMKRAVFLESFFSAQHNNIQHDDPNLDNRLRNV